MTALRRVSQSRGLTWLGLVLTVPLVVRAVAEQLGVHVPYVDEIADIAITIAGVLGVPLLAVSPSISRRRSDGV